MVKKFALNLKEKHKVMTTEEYNEKNRKRRIFNEEVKKKLN